MDPMGYENNLPISQLMIQIFNPSLSSVSLAH